MTEEDIENQNKIIIEALKKPNTILFDDFYKLSQELTDRNKDLPDVVKIPKHIDYMLSDAEDALEPALIINLKDNEEHLYYKGSPIWRNNVPDEISLAGFGLINGDRTRPIKHTLFDTAPHMNINGATGHGKSVTANSMIMNCALEQPPWYVQLYLIDPKIVEFAPYIKQDKIMPHVNIVGATPDYGYAESILDYLMSIMEKRNQLTAKYGVKNIKEFEAKYGLTLPMILLFIDELMALANAAGKKQGQLNKKLLDLVNLGRNAGLRICFASQVRVTLFDKGMWSNVVTRVALGCSVEDSISNIGNPGANKNYGKKGRVVINTNSSEGRIEDNTDSLCPFLPSDRIGTDQSSLHDIMHHLYDVAEKIGYKVTDPQTSFVIDDKLFSDEFLSLLSDKPSLDKIYIGEPSYVNKTGFKLNSISLKPNSEYETASGKNIAIFTESIPMMYNLLTMVLDNIQVISERDNINVDLISPSLPNIDIIQKLKPDMKYRSKKEIMSFKEAVWPTVMYLALNRFIVSVDYSCFNNQPLDNRFVDMYFDMFAKACKPATELNKKRLKYAITLLSTPAGASLFNSNPLPIYKEGAKLPPEVSLLISTVMSMFIIIDKAITHEPTVAIREESFKKAFLILGNLEGYDGFDRGRYNDREGTFIMNTLATGPMYGTYIVTFAPSLVERFSASAVAFKHVLSYGLSARGQNGMKISDNYPEFDKRVYTYTDLNTAEKVTISYKYPTYPLIKK